MTFLSKSFSFRHFCTIITFTIFTLNTLSTSSIIASVNMNSTNKNNPKEGFHGGVFFITKDYRKVGEKLLSQHNILKKALIYSPDSNYVEFESETTLTPLNSSNLSFTEVTQQFQN